MCNFQYKLRLKSLFIKEETQICHDFEIIPFVFFYDSIIFAALKVSYVS
jgi:hypothetical protein